VREYDHSIMIPAINPWIPTFVDEIEVIG